jgi:hypothetical protein
MEGKTPLSDALGKAPPFRLEPGIHMLTTAPNPRHPGTGWDAGQRGWRLHAVEWTEADNEYHARTGFTRSRKPALCGCVPAHGWGLDLFIEDECQRCDKVIERREIAAAAKPSGEVGHAE